MNQYINTVAVKHFGDNTPYLFQLPLCENLQAGEYVIVETKRGKQVGVCLCDSVWVNRDAMGLLLVPYPGATLPLQRVLRRYVEMKYREGELDDDQNALEEAGES